MIEGVVMYKYEHGEEILYTADEVFVPEGYQKDVQGDTLINRYVLYMFEGEVCKHWQDGGDQDRYPFYCFLAHFFSLSLDSKIQDIIPLFLPLVNAAGY